MLTLAQLHQAARGLAYMHEKGFVHGDLKGVRAVFYEENSHPELHSSQIY